MTSSREPTGTRDDSAIGDAGGSDQGPGAMPDADAGPGASAMARARHRHGPVPAAPDRSVSVDVALFHRARLARQAALAMRLDGRLDERAPVRVHDDGAPERDACAGLGQTRHSSPGVPAGRVSTRVRTG